MSQFIKFYFTSSMLNISRTLIHPSSGACDFSIVSPHWLCVLVSKCVGVSVWLVGVVSVWLASTCHTATTPTSHTETPTQCGVDHPLPPSAELYFYPNPRACVFMACNSENFKFMYLHNTCLMEEDGTPYAALCFRDKYKINTN